MSCKKCRNDLLAANKIRPINFLGVNNYRQEIGSAYFCWRWFKKYGRTDQDLRMLTIEFKLGLGHDDPYLNDPIIRPTDLFGINGYYDLQFFNIEKSYFCWRWLEKDGIKHRVVTLENSNRDFEQSYHGTRDILPEYLAGIDDYSVGIEKLRFCWRSYSGIDGTEYKVITLE